MRINRRTSTCFNPLWKLFWLLFWLFYIVQISGFNVIKWTAFHHTSTFWLQHCYKKVQQCFQICQCSKWQLAKVNTTLDTCCFYLWVSILKLSPFICLKLIFICFFTFFSTFFNLIKWASNTSCTAVDHQEAISSFLWCPVGALCSC